MTRVGIIECDNPNCKHIKHMVISNRTFINNQSAGQCDKCCEGEMRLVDYVKESEI